MAFEFLADYITDLVLNVGLSIADYLFILTLMASALFIAVELRYGLYIMFIVSGFELVLFILWGMPTLKVIVMAFILLVAMTLTLLIKNNPQEF